jgi:hypothetical protein
VGEEGEGYVPVPSVPASHLVVGKPYLSFGLLKSDLHSPATARDLRQLLERGALGSEDRVGAELLRIIDGSAHQEPSLEAFLHGRIERQPRPVVEARTLRALPGREALEARLCSIFRDEPSFPEDLEYFADAVLAEASPHVSLA